MKKLDVGVIGDNQWIFQINLHYKTNLCTIYQVNLR